MEHIWKYEDYSRWSRMLAESYTVKELERMLGKASGETERLQKSHLANIGKENRKVSCSQRLAQSGVKCSANYEKTNALKNALELHTFYPEKCKR